MIGFVGRQLVAGAVTVLIVATLVFVLMRITPGDPAKLLMGDWADFVSAEHLETVRRSMGLEEPLLVQYGVFLRSIVSGEFGVSFRTGETVAHMIWTRLPYTIDLAFAGLLVALSLGVPAGILAARLYGGVFDRLTMFLTMVGLAAPNFWFGLVLLYVFSFRLGWFPMFGAPDDRWTLETIWGLVLPAITVGTSSAALLARLTRSSMLEVLGQNYVRTARAKGVSETSVVLKHAFRNASLPVITLMGINVAYLIGGSVVIEVVFARPGLGRLLVDSIFNRDYPVVQGAVMLLAILVVAVNLLTDVVYGWLDPRLRIS
jgi:peptide/nickel transport system permease protein